MTIYFIHITYTFMQDIANYNISKPNTPGVKKEPSGTKKALLNNVKSKWMVTFDRLRVLVMMTSLQNIDILGAQDLLMLIRSKFLTKMTIF